MKATQPLKKTAALLTAPARLTLRAVGSVLRGVRSHRRGSAAPAAAMPATVTGAPAPRRTSAPAPAVVATPDAPLLTSDLPIPSYDALNAKDAVAAIKALTDPDEVRTMLRFEEENAKRTTVHRAARSHVEWLEAGAAVLPS